jgi:hypothetical protein
LEVGVNFSGGDPSNVGSHAREVMDLEINDDSDLARKMVKHRDFTMSAAAVIDAVADDIYDALYDYDKGRKATFGTVRAKAVVRPLRLFAASMRQGHRVSMAVVRLYQKKYAEDIAANRASKRKSKFNPGGKAAA